MLSEGGYSTKNHQQLCQNPALYQAHAGEMFFLNLGSEAQPLTLQKIHEKMHFPVLCRLVVTNSNLSYQVPG